MLLQKTDPKTVRAIEWTNFFMADVQTGLGPFLAAYLAVSGWSPEHVGLLLTFGGIFPIILQTPAGALVDRIHRKRLLVISGLAMLTVGAIMLAASTRTPVVVASQVLLGSTGPFLGPAIAAITLGVVGAKAFDRQFGRNQAFSSAGNVVTAALVAAVSHYISNRAIFITAALLTIPTAVSVLSINGHAIDYEAARGGEEADGAERGFQAVLGALLRNRTLLVFMFCCFLFHFANAAMLPQLGEMLSRGPLRDAAPFMSACIIVTQLVITVSAAWIGTRARRWGRKPLLLVGFGVLPLRAVLYTMTHVTGALIAVQLLDGVANAIFGVVSILVVADLTRGTGSFNLMQGALGTAVGIGAALSNAFGGKLVQSFGFHVSFLGLGAVAMAAFLLLLFAVPETKADGGALPPALPQRAEA